MEPLHYKPLIALADYLNGYAFKPEDHSEEGLPIIRIEQLKDPDTLYDHYDGEVPVENYIDNGDLIFSWSASLFLRIWERGRAILNQHLFKVIPKSNVDKLFLKYCIEFNLPELAKSSHGSTMKHITRRELANFHVTVPASKQTQSKIAQVLAAIDRAIEQTEALIAKYQRIKTGLMQDLLTRGIDECGNLRHPAPSTFKNIEGYGLFPHDWRLSCVENEFDLATGFTLGKHRYPRKNKRKYLRVANVYRENIDLHDVAELEAEDYEMAGRILRENDLLIVEGHANIDEIGRCGLVPEQAAGLTFQNHLFRLRAKEINPIFAWAWLNSQITRTYWRHHCRTSSGLNTINQTLLKALPIVVPDLAEQQRIIDVILGHYAQLRTEEAYLNKLRRLKTGLMQDLLTGKVSVAPLLEKEQESLSR